MNDLDISPAPKMYEDLQGLYESACLVGDDAEWVSEIGDLLSEIRGN